MKVLHLTSELDGGAGLAALRLHSALCHQGVDSHLLHGSGSSPVDACNQFVPSGSAPVLYGDRVLDQLVWRARRHDVGLFTRTRRLSRCGIAEALAGADLVHLHWIAKWLDWSALFAAIPASTPIVLTLHDSSFFAGGCHQTNDCQKFKSHCLRCPALRKTRGRDLAADGFAIRKKLFRGRTIIPVPNSAWMAAHAAQATLLNPFTLQPPIYPGIDTAAFRPLDRQVCRDILGIPQDHFIIAAGSADLSDTNKGIPLLLNALSSLPEDVRSRCGLLTYGSGCLPNEISGVPIYQQGFIAAERLLATLYSAADVYCTPSQMETFGMTAVEAGACGIPVIAFSTGGLPEIVHDGETGWLVPLLDGEEGIRNALHCAFLDSHKRSHLGNAAMNFARAQFDIARSARQYIKHYQQFLPK